MPHQPPVHGDVITSAQRPRLPPWLRRSIPLLHKRSSIEALLKNNAIHTVCAEAHCPNRTLCQGQGTATFMILGAICTRSCSFCAVNHGNPISLDMQEPQRIADAARLMKLRHVVVTSVTRDDLPDGGAGLFAETVTKIRQAIPEVRVEVLIPDFNADSAALTTVIQSDPDIINHNIETVPRLYPLVRPQAQYRRSLEVITFVSEKAPAIKTKSGLMIGLGETPLEVEQVLTDLRTAGCVMVTIGQYLQPTPAQLPVVSFPEPEQFALYERYARSLGFASVAAGPYVRSSYNAEALFSVVQATH